MFVGLYAGFDDAFWLDSGEDEPRGFSYVGAPSSADDVATEKIVDGVVQVASTAGSSDGSMFDFLSRELFMSSQAEVDATGFRLGWVGWFGYEPGLSAMMRITRVVVFDHESGQVVLRGLASDPDLEDWFDATVASLLELPQGEAVAPALPGTRRAILRHSRDEYLRLIDDCQRAIRRGDAYQLCLTNQIVIDEPADPVSTYRRLRRASPSHHGGFMRIGDTALLSISPEQFLDITPKGRMRTRPIKGTRPRGSTQAQDDFLRAELDASEKERAENVMIVDLMRNDLGRVAVVGSVAVPELFAIEAYANVYQLVSTVEAQLDSAFQRVDAIRASFPAGSMTGAPKVSAMTILKTLEAGNRGLYAGAFGYLGFDGRVDLAMTIRSIVTTPAGSTIGTGGGITALSVPGEEFEEILVKAAPLLASLGAELG